MRQLREANDSDPDRADIYAMLGVVLKRQGNHLTNPDPLCVMTELL